MTSTPRPSWRAAFNVGDTNQNGLLDPGEDWKYTFNGIAQAGQYENNVVTTGTGNLSNLPVTANSISHYLGVAPPTPAIAIVKQTNGQTRPQPARPGRPARQHGDLDL